MQKTNLIDIQEGYPALHEAEPALKPLEFGLKSVEQLPYVHLNVFTQTRKSYPEESMAELVRSIEAMDAAGRPNNLLLNPIFVNILEPDNAARYLDDLNYCHKTEHTLAEAQPLPDGRYPIVVAGHRRRLAIGTIIARQSGDPEASTVASNVAYDLSFAEALRIQMEENVHLQLPVHEVARAIQASYRYGLERGEFKSVADCARVLPYGEEKVRNALRFCDLPDFLQDWVEDERIPYGAAVALYPVMNTLRKRYSSVEETEREEIVMDSMMVWAIKIINNGWGKDMVSAQVGDFIRSQDQMSNLQLFVTDEKIAVRRQRQRAYHDLFLGGLGRMRSFVALAGQAELFRGLPAEQQEAVLVELDQFKQYLGSIATKSTQPSLL